MMRPSRLWHRFTRYLRRCELPQWQRDLMIAIDRKRKAHKPSKREREQLKRRVHDELRAKFKPQGEAA